MKQHPRRNARSVRALVRREADLAQYETGDFTNAKNKNHETTIKIAKREIDILRKITNRYS